MTESRLILDFSKVRDFDTIKERVLALLQDFPGKARYVEVTFHQRGVGGASVKNREQAANEDSDLNDFAGVIAESIVDYAKGKDGRDFSGATVVIPDRR